MSQYLVRYFFSRQFLSHLSGRLTNNSDMKNICKMNLLNFEKSQQVSPQHFRHTRQVRQRIFVFDVFWQPL